MLTFNLKISRSTNNIGDVIYVYFTGQELVGTCSGTFIFLEVKKNGTCGIYIKKKVTIGGFTTTNSFVEVYLRSPINQPQIYRFVIWWERLGLLYDDIVHPTPYYNVIGNQSEATKNGSREVSIYLIQITW